MTKFYSVSVGAGDESYITLGALDALETADIIAVPVKKSGEKSAALEIVRRKFDMNKKQILELEFSMTHDQAARKAARKAAAEKVLTCLRSGKTVAMITLGDVSVYSTCSYVHYAVEDAGFDTEIISGVTSFCAAANKAKISLCEDKQSVAIVPSLKSDLLEAALDNFDTIIIMKAGNDAAALYDLLKKRNLLGSAVAAQNIGIENELIEPLRPDRDYGYFTTVIVKKQGS